jgi:hypothetical protein
MKQPAKPNRTENLEGESSNERGRQLRRPYSWLDSAVLPSSPESQPITRSLCRGSGRSQSKHWNVRCPFPSGGSAKTSRAPHRGHIGRSASPIPQILPLLRIFVNQNVQRISWFQRRNTILAHRPPHHLVRGADRGARGHLESARRVGSERGRQLRSALLGYFSTHFASTP